MSPTFSKLQAHFGSRSPSPTPRARPAQAQHLASASIAEFPALEVTRQICVLVSNLGSGALNVPGLQAVGQIGCQIVDTIQVSQFPQRRCNNSTCVDALFRK